ncbi:hypothetical protein [Paraglaciecola arctica]|uniref:Uncharacterized protein n=1 Tax=Paraglaciecola arctica BSs20135 TaxID=493475 RepID=K6XFT5_9ALTE|nr:hypothetical protein [Paraglaciecola arctica]GAC19504.1 hypothetical protein GARC_2538 [Paraglaciecola arctica BSs20135]
MSTTKLKLEESGSLHPPGPLGRLVRVIFGALCGWYLYNLIKMWPLIIDTNGIHPLLWNGVFPSLLLVNYVINIGWSRDWKKYPMIGSLLVFALFGMYSYLSYGKLETQILANSIFLWLIYIYCHLGFSFLLSAAIATPGCEMRALHHLYTLLTGIRTKEHCCPIGPLHPLDQWELKRQLSKKSRVPKE